MSGRPKFTRSKRITHFHTSHKSIYDGSETQHVKSDLTASVDGSFVVKADKASFEGPVVFESTASLDGDLDVGGAVDFGSAQSGNITRPNLTGNSYSVLPTDYTILVDDNDAQVTATVVIPLFVGASWAGRILNIKK